MRERIVAAWVYLNTLDTSAWIKRYIEALFKQDGPVYVGMFSVVVLYLALREAAANKWTAPVWLVKETGLFVIVLITYAGYKGIKWGVDSVFNSKKGEMPGVTSSAGQELPGVTPVNAADKKE